MSVIEIQGLTKYYGKTIGVKNVSFAVEKGEIFGFVGPNGAGKSTTIKLLFNLIYPTAGKAEILGHDVVLKSKQLKEFTAYVPTEVRFYEGFTVKKLLHTTMEFYQVKEITELHRLCQFFELQLNKKITQLSMGNKKKVSIVSALLANPQVLIMDEPTNGLDPLMQKRLFEELKRRTAKGLTVLLSSHNLSEIEEYCSRVAFIKEGKILAVENLQSQRQPAKIVTAWSKKGFTQLLNLDLEIIDKSETKIVFAYSGSPKVLVEALAQAELDDFIVENRSLEDQFMALYEGGA